MGELSVPSDLDNLPDIATASYGPPPALAETVHGPDDRVQITNTSRLSVAGARVAADHRGRQLAAGSAQGGSSARTR